MKSLVFPVIVTVLAIPLIGRAGRAAETQRTVFFSAADAKGTAVTDLTAADVTVKENGKERAVASLAPAKGPVHVSLLVDDAGTGAFQGAVAQFIDAMLGHAQFAIRAFNPQATRLTDFTDDVPALKTAINGIGPRGRVSTGGEQMMEAVGEAAKELQQRKAERPVIIVLTVGGETAQSNQAEPALNALKASGASLDVLHLAGIELGQVLGDGPKRSGGAIDQINSGVVPGPVLAKVADTLLHQYEVTYTLPDGVKPNEKFAISTSRKGVTLLAPTRVPDK